MIINWLNYNYPQVTLSFALTNMGYPKSYILPAGRYFIGDICYALSDFVYNEIWGDNFGFREGLYNHQKGTFVMGRAMYGNGDYLGTDGRVYAIDSGIVGMVSWDLVDNKDCKSGSVHEFSESIYFCITGEGHFIFSSGKVKLVIDTASKNLYTMIK